MELAIILAVAAAAVWFFVFRKKEDVKEALAPYKVEEPVAPTAPRTCGCGRSTTGYCVGLHSLSAEEWATHADNPNKTAPVAKEEAPVAPAKKPRAKKPAAIKAADKPKAPAKPRAKKPKMTVAK